MPDNTWLCPLCSVGDQIVEFKTEEEMAEHVRVVHRSGDKPKEKPVLPPIDERGPKKEKPKVVKRPVLVYRWTGQCPECGGEVDTIPLDLDKRTNKIAAVCWCQSCRKKIDQREVDKL